MAQILTFISLLFVLLIPRDGISASKVQVAEAGRAILYKKVFQISSDDCMKKYFIDVQYLRASCVVELAPKLPDEQMGPSTQIAIGHPDGIDIKISGIVQGYIISIEADDVANLASEKIKKILDNIFSEPDFGEIEMTTFVPVETGAQSSVR